MNTDQLLRMRHGSGFIAALDQSGGSTPKALKQYGIPETAYSGDEEMFRLVHEMRTRIITSPAFSGEYILGAILFEDTMDRTVDGALTADYLWEVKGIVPFLKVDKGLMEQKNGVQLMKPIPSLDGLLERAVLKNIFGTKMRSVIHEANAEGIEDIVEQQFVVARQIAKAGLIPILEPEAAIHSEDRQESERLLLKEILRQLAHLDEETKVMFKLSIPVVDNFYAPLMGDEHVVRVVALSGGYTQAEATERLARNPGLIASFSRALVQDLSAQQSDEEFNAALSSSVKAVYEASIT